MLNVELDTRYIGYSQTGLRFNLASRYGACLPAAAAGPGQGLPPPPPSARLNLRPVGI